MYLGRFVEIGQAADLFANPRHPYTRALLSAIPVPDPRAHQDRIPLTGGRALADQSPRGVSLPHPLPDRREGGFAT